MDSAGSLTIVQDVLLPRPKANPRTLTIFGLGIASFSVAFVVLLMARTSYDVWGAALVAPALFLVTLPMLRREARREGDPKLFWFLVLALVAKMLGSIVRYFVTFTILGTADASGFHKGGVQLAARFRSGNFNTHLDEPSEGPFVRLFTGVLYTFIGPTKGGGFFFFAWMAFIGAFFFYRAFKLAVPEGNAKTYARFVFFFPSMLFWPSSIGKDAWIIFSLGIAAFGVARLLTGSHLRGFIGLIIGLLLVTVLRPHIAAMIAVGLAVALLVRRLPDERRRRNVLTYIALGALVLVTAAGFLLKANSFLKANGVDTSKGVSAALRTEVGRTAIGAHSDFSGSAVVSPSRIPLAFVTVLFRPFPNEASNAQLALASLEGMFLLGLVLTRLKRIVAAIRSSRRQPYVMVAIVFTCLFVIAFSSFANFGLLVRERTQLLPLLFILLSMPAASRAQRGSRRGRADMRAMT